MAVKKVSKEIQTIMLRMEVDYHLMTLHDAIEANDTKEITAQKKILEKKTKELYGS